MIATDQRRNLQLADYSDRRGAESAGRGHPSPSRRAEIPQIANRERSSPMTANELPDTDTVRRSVSVESPGTIPEGGGLNVTLKTSAPRFISHFHFLITVSAYRGPLARPFLFVSSLPASPRRPPPSSSTRALESSFSRRIAPSLALSSSLSPSIR